MISKKKFQRKQNNNFVYVIVLFLDKEDLSQQSSEKELKTLNSDEKPDFKFVKKDDPGWEDLDYCVEVRIVNVVTLKVGSMANYLSTFRNVCF